MSRVRSTHRPAPTQGPDGLPVLDDAARAALWGDLFEVAVKRGCLGYLDHVGLLQSASIRQRWTDLAVNDLHVHMTNQSGAVDPGYRERQASSLDHLLL